LYSNLYGIFVDLSLSSETELHSTVQLFQSA